jgi:hypothetical protein
LSIGRPLPVGEGDLSSSSSFRQKPESLKAGSDFTRRLRRALRALRWTPAFAGVTNDFPSPHSRSGTWFSARHCFTSAARRVG